MFLCMMTHRLHVLLDDERWRRLETEAERRGTAMASLVREAIDLAFPARDEEHRRQAWETILRAPLMPVPGPSELREELDAARVRGV
jgi:hypothetical protein